MARRVQATAAAAFIAVVLAGCTGGGDEGLSESASASAGTPGATAGSGSSQSATPQADASSGAESGGSDESGTGDDSGESGAVTVTIDAIDVDLGLDELRVLAVVGGVAEDGGDCEFTLTSGGSEMTLEGQGVFNVTRTECTATAALDDLSAGAWQVVVSYESDEGSAVSAPREVEIP